MDVDATPRTEEGKVRLWLDRISVAKKYRDRSLDDLGVPRFLNYYNGQYDVRMGNIMVPPINEVFAYVQTISSLLNFRNPAIALNPKKTGTILGARILEQCVAYDWRDLNLKDECDLELIDTPISGMGWHKTGYWSETQKQEKETYLKDEGIYSNRVSWKDIVWNIGSIKPPEDCQWMAHRIIKPTEEIKEMYPGNSKLEGTTHPNIARNELRSAIFKDDLNYSVIWEIYSRKDREIYCVAENYPTKFLKKPTKWPQWMDEFPFDLLAFNLTPDEAFPIPDIKPIEPQILEEIKLTAMAINHVKRWNRQLIVKKGAFDPSEQDKIEKGYDGAMVESSGNPGESHAVLQYGPLPPDIYAIINKIEQTRNRVSGLTATSQGGIDQTRTRTVGELEMMQQGSGLRTDKKRDKFERHLESIARKIIKIRQANFDLEQVVKITGEPPEEIIRAFQAKYDPITKSITFTKDDIQGEYDVEVQAGSTLALDKATRARVLENVLRTAVPLAQLPSLPPFLQVVISELLKDYEIKALEQAFNVQSRFADMKNMQEQGTKNVHDEKVAADTEKRKAQAQQIKTETAIQGAEALVRGAQLGILPEMIQFGRGAGVLPEEAGSNGRENVVR